MFYSIIYEFIEFLNEVFKCSICKSFNSVFNKGVSKGFICYGFFKVDKVFCLFIGYFEFLFGNLSYLFIYNWVNNWFEKNGSLDRRCFMDGF